MKLPLFNKKEVDSCLPIFSSLECILVKMKGPKRGLHLWFHHSRAFQNFGNCKHMLPKLINDFTIGFTGDNTRCIYSPLKELKAVFVVLFLLYLVNLCETLEFVLTFMLTYMHINLTIPKLHCALCAI